MKHEEIIQNFYTAFAQGNSEGMAACYHEDIVFEDPGFGQLHGQKAVKMWEMLVSQRSAATQITFSQVEVDGDTGKANWKAEYLFGPKKRKVVNKIQARFKFKDGKIIEHIDTFDLWKWSSQALGLSGYLLGWSPFMKRKVQSFANKKLSDYIQKQPN